MDTAQVHKNRLDLNSLCMARVGEGWAARLRAEVHCISNGIPDYMGSHGQLMKNKELVKKMIVCKAYNDMAAMCAALTDLHGLVARLHRDHTDENMLVPHDLMVEAIEAARAGVAYTVTTYTLYCLCVSFPHISNQAAKAVEVKKLVAFLAARKEVDLGADIAEAVEPTCQCSNAQVYPN